jgi:hypothetical protein
VCNSQWFHLQPTSWLTQSKASMLMRYLTLGSGRIYDVYSFITPHLCVVLEGQWTKMYTIFTLLQISLCNKSRTGPELSWTVLKDLYQKQWRLTVFRVINVGCHVTTCDGFPCLQTSTYDSSINTMKKFPFITFQLSHNIHRNFTKAKCSEATWWNHCNSACLLSSNNYEHYSSNHSLCFLNS